MKSKRKKALRFCGGSYYCATSNAGRSTMVRLNLLLIIALSTIAIGCSEHNPQINAGEPPICKPDDRSYSLSELTNKAIGDALASINRICRPYSSVGMFKQRNGNCCSFEYGRSTFQNAAGEELRTTDLYEDERDGYLIGRLTLVFFCGGEGHPAKLRSYGTLTSCGSLKNIISTDDGPVPKSR